MESKKPFYKKWWFWVIIFIVIAGIAGASGNQPKKIESPATNEVVATNTPTQEPEPKAEIFKVSDKVQLGDYILTVNAAEDCASTNQFTKPQSGNKFFVVDVTQENDGDDSRSYNLWDFKLQDDKDFSYQTSLSACKNPAFGAGDLQKGQKTRGFITFEIPKENKATKLIFTPSWLSSDQIMIELQ